MGNSLSSPMPSIRPQFLISQANTTLSPVKSFGKISRQYPPTGKIPYQVIARKSFYKFDSSMIFISFIGVPTLVIEISIALFDAHAALLGHGSSRLLNTSNHITFIISCNREYST